MNFENFKIHSFNQVSNTMSFNIILKAMPLKGYARLDLQHVETKERKDSPFVVLINNTRNRKTVEVVGWMLSDTVDDEDDIRFDYHPEMTPLLKQLTKNIPEITIAKRLLDEKVVCAGCDKMVSKSETKLCPCRHIRYCDKECQLAHWKEHKASCTYKK